MVSGWTGIPVGKMVRDEIKTVLDARGRSSASASSARTTPSRRSPSASARRAPSLDRPARPIGVFLLVGPSGVGKTETALALADILYGGERNMIVDQHVGVQGGAHRLAAEGLAARATSATARAACSPRRCASGPTASCCSTRSRRPTPTCRSSSTRSSTRACSRTAKGATIDFKNTIILLTSNVGTDTIMKLCADPDDAARRRRRWPRRSGPTC